LDTIIQQRVRPETVVSDNGTELTSNAILDRADQASVGWHYIVPGKPRSVPPLLPGPQFRPRPPRTRRPVPLHQAQSLGDRRLGQADEPNSEGSPRPSISPRRLPTVPAAPRRPPHADNFPKTDQTCRPHAHLNSGLNS
jgi:hypothetical protein